MTEYDRRLEIETTEMHKVDGLADAFVRGIKETPSGFFKPLALSVSAMKALLNRVRLGRRG